MTPDEARIVRYLEDKNYRSRDVIARHFRWDAVAVDLRLRSLLASSCIEEDARRYYRLTDKGLEQLAYFDNHWKITPFDGSRPLV